jgi:hypothetical protein
MANLKRQHAEMTTTPGSRWKYMSCLCIGTHVTGSTGHLNVNEMMKYILTKSKQTLSIGIISL